MVIRYVALISLLILVLSEFITILLMKVIGTEVIMKRNNTIKRQSTLNNLFKAMMREDAIKNYFSKRNIKSVAVYGYGYNGKQLVECLEANDIQVLYAIDRNNRIEGKLPIYTMHEEKPRVDLIVISLSYDYMDVYYELIKNTESEIILLDELTRY